MHRAVGRHEPPAVQEPCSGDGPRRNGETVVVAKMLGRRRQQRVPSLVAGECGSWATMASRRLGGAYLKRAMNCVTQRSAS